MASIPFQGLVRIIVTFGPCQLAFASQALAIGEDSLLAETGQDPQSPPFTAEDWDGLLMIGKDYRLQIESQENDGQLALVKARLREKTWRGHRLELQWQIIASDYLYEELVLEQARRANLQSGEDRSAAKRHLKRFYVDDL